MLIYLNIETKRTILERIEQTLRPVGYLFMGGAETMLNISESFTRMPFKLSGCCSLGGE